MEFEFSYLGSEYQVLDAESCCRYGGDAYHGFLGWARMGNRHGCLFYGLRGFVSLCEDEMRVVFTLRHYGFQVEREV
jgi:hypothetical protein